MKKHLFMLICFLLCLSTIKAENSMDEAEKYIDQHYKGAISIFVESYAKDIKNMDREKISYVYIGELSIIDDSLLADFDGKIIDIAKHNSGYHLAAITYDGTAKMFFEASKENENYALTLIGGFAEQYTEAMKIVEKIVGLNAKTSVYSYGFNHYLLVVEVENNEYVIPVSGSGKLDESYYKIRSVKELPTAEEFVAERLEIIKYFNDEYEKNGAIVYGDDIVQMTAHPSNNNIMLYSDGAILLVAGLSLYFYKKKSIKS